VPYYDRDEEQRGKKKRIDIVTGKNKKEGTCNSIHRNRDHGAKGDIFTQLYRYDE
jgi:hypothetical protein